jgi:hypothetical protein
MRRFPKILEDGGFRVRLRFGGAPKSDLPAIQRWLTDWAAANAAETIFGHHFGDLFSLAPVASRDSSGQLRIVLNGLPAGIRLWRDWYVRLVRDTLGAFPELGDLSKVEDDG